MDSLIIYTEPVFMERLREIIAEDEESADKLSALTSIKSLKEFMKIAEDEKLRTDIRDTKAEKLLCYAAAEDIKKNGQKSMFLRRAAVQLIPGIVNGAKFLVKYELI
jgi:hypothetical protein